jgi:site-specific DNA-cytosine methylase
VKGISLFSGAGGFEIGFERAGIETVLQVEMDPWCQQVLQRHWPEVDRIDDVCKVDPSALRGRCGDVVGIGAGSDVERLGGAPRGAAGTGRRADGSLGEPASGDAPDGLRAPDHQRRREAGPGLSSGVDVLFGGFPCQDVSVAGKRAGLSGERSGLWFEFRRIVSELRPNWVVIENVPGLLSSHSGRDFTTILLGLEELGYGWAYRVLDARWFGVPQRRRRVFIVGCAGGAARAASVLAVCEGCGGHPAPRREARQDVAYALAASARGTGDGHGNAWNSTYIAPAFTVPSAHRGVGNGWNTNYVPEDAIAWDDRNQAADDVHHTLRGAGLQRSDVVLAATLSGGGHPGSNMPGRHKEDDQNLVVGNTLLKGGHSNNPLDDNLVVGSQIDAGQARPLVATRCVRSTASSPSVATAPTT